MLPIVGGILSELVLKLFILLLCGCLNGQPYQEAELPPAPPDEPCQLP